MNKFPIQSDAVLAAAQQGHPVARAFPSGDGQYAGGPNHDYGMSLRDWFAGQAVVGLLASLAHPNSRGLGQTNPDQVASHAFDIADAMLARSAS